MRHGDPALDREVRAEARQRSRRRDYIVLAAGIIIFLAIVLLVAASQS